MQVQLDGIGSAIGALVSAPGFEGAAAGRARAYLGDVHGLLLSSLRTVLVEYQQLVLSYKDGLHTGVDSDPHAEFDEDALEGVESRMGVRAGEFEEQARELELAVESVSDLLSFFGPRNAGAVAGDVRQVGQWARLAREAVGEYEFAHRDDLVGVREQLGRIGAVLDEYGGGSVGASYDRAGLAGNAAVVALVSGDAGLVAGQQARAESMEGVFAREDERLAVLDAEAARERVKWGWVKAVGAVITIVVGVVAIVASAGAATPLVIGAAGVAATMFGASDLVEAGRDIRYGMQGDAYTRAGNPLRDTVFGGNQTLYDVVGFAVCATAGAGIPLTQAAKLGMVPRASVARAVVREGVQDLGAQQVAAVAMPHLGPEGALAAAVLGGGAAGRRGGGSTTASGMPGGLPVAGLERPIHPSGLRVGDGRERNLYDQMVDPHIHPKNADIVEGDYHPFGHMGPEQFAEQFHSWRGADESLGWVWPSGEGAVPGTVVQRPISPLDEGALDRIGGATGYFFSPLDTPFGARSLPPDRLNHPRQSWTIDMENQFVRNGLVEIEIAETAPAFGQRGGGTQFRFVDEKGKQMSQDQLERYGILVRVSEGD